MKHSAIVVPRETELKLHEFIALLGRWNTKINLVSKSSIGEWWSRHILDSLQIVPLLPPGRGPIIDLGSGAGFPGIVLALMTLRPVHMIESDHRKAAFLNEAIRVLGLDFTRVHNVRIEQVLLAPAPIVTARALASLTDLLKHAHRLLEPCGAALFPKGRTWRDELTAAMVNWNMRLEQFPSQTEPQSVILRISEISPVIIKP